MRFVSFALCIALVALAAQTAHAKDPAPAAPGTASQGSHIEITADQSLEWYQDQNLYVARGNAKAVRGQTTIEADVLTAHERPSPPKSGNAETKTAAAKDAAGAAPLPGQQGTPVKSSGGSNDTGDIDKMTAEGHVHVTTPKSNIYGEHGVYDLDKHVTYLTGNNLKYQTIKETVTAKDSLEYWEDKKLAVARGDAVGISGDRHVQGDVLTAQFRDLPNGKSEMHTLTADGHVVIITPNDVSRGERAVYDTNRNIAILTGNVRITRSDGTQLAGDVGEVDFATNQSRLLNEGKGTRVRALLVSKSKPKTDKTAAVPVSSAATASSTTASSAP